jgi:predicted alpha/beta-hydrolase family hydrolase
LMARPAVRRTTRRVEVTTPRGVAWADVDRPAGTPVGLLVLGHGAGGGVEAADLLATRRAALEAEWAVARVTQPYRVAGRRSPPAGPVLDEAWLPVVTKVRSGRGLRVLPVVFGGRSSGARVACRTATAGHAVGVLALAFPLHPPGHPERSRLDELAGPTVPVLVVQGDRDPFGIPPAADGRRIVVVPGDHSLRSAAEPIRLAVAAFLTSLVG